MFKKLRRIWLDHKAMEILRKRYRNFELTGEMTGTQGRGLWTCKDGISEAYDHDPADAIFKTDQKSYSRFSSTGRGDCE